MKDDETWDGTNLEHKVLGDGRFIGEQIPEQNNKKVDYSNARCKKSNYDKKFYLCKESVKQHNCLNALRFNSQTFCYK